eukprot:110705_1
MSKKQRKTPRRKKKPPKTNSHSKPMGYCNKVMRKCICECNRFNCGTCHVTDKNGCLIKVPEYEPDTEAPCHWTGKQTSIAKHNKKIHGTKSKHLSGWRRGTQSQSQATKNQLS